MPQGKNRYPGIRSFEPDDQRLFYGRSSEIDQLFNLIKIKPMVVLFGKSGLGKTSLLKAGVGPLLVNQRYYPVLIRLQDVGVAPTTSVLNELEQFIDQDLLNKYGNKTDNKIWEALNASSFKTANGAVATPILIFDQFEELFSHPKKVRKEFSSFVGDLTESRLPADIEGALNQVPRSERTKELMDWFRAPDVKVIFAIRSDRMSELHALRHDIPAILQNRFGLKPLKSHQAKEAIEKPAGLEGEEFLTAPFSYAPETIEKIQTELSNEFGEIESFQLQIICQYIERKVKKEQAAGNQNVVVTPDYLGDEDGIRGILKNYYNTQISLLGNNEEQTAARKLLEEGLIISKRRISVAEAVVKETYNINDDLLEKLLASRLIRPEDTRLGRTYEISHDTLVEPILDALQKRKATEERLENIRERELIQKKQNRARIASIFNFLIALGCAIGLGFVYNWYKDAEIAKKEAVFLKEELQLLNLELAEKTKSFLEQDSTIKELEKDSMPPVQKAMLKEERKKLEETKKELKAAIVTSEKTVTKDPGAKPVNTRQKMIENLVLANKEEDEPKRKAARDRILQSFKNDPRIIAEILDVAKNNIDEAHLNNIYQIIYLLDRIPAKTLNSNNNNEKVLLYTTAVRNSKLVGSQTLGQISSIEGKLKGTGDVKPSGEEETKDNEQTDTKGQPKEGIKPNDEIKPGESIKPGDNKKTDDGKKTIKEKDPGDGKKSNKEND